MGTPLQGAASHPPVVERAALTHLALQGALGRDQGWISLSGQVKVCVLPPKVQGPAAGLGPLSQDVQEVPSDLFGSRQSRTIGHVVLAHPSAW